MPCSHVPCRRRPPARAGLPDVGAGQHAGLAVGALPDPSLDIIVSLLEKSAKASSRLSCQAGGRAVSRTLTKARVRAPELGDFVARGWPGTLTRLQLDCESQKSLPASLGQLPALQTLDLSGCSALASLLGALGQLSALQTMHLGGCGALTSPPASLGQLSALRIIKYY